MHAHSVVCLSLSSVALLPKKRRTTWIVLTFLNSSTSLGVKYALSSRPSTSSGMTMALLLLPTVATAAQHKSTLATSAANATRVCRAVAPPCPNTRTNQLCAAPQLEQGRMGNNDCIRPSRVRVTPLMTKLARSMLHPLFVLTRAVTLSPANAQNNQCFKAAASGKKRA